MSACKKDSEYYLQNVFGGDEQVFDQAGYQQYLLAAAALSRQGRVVPRVRFVVGLDDKRHKEALFQLRCECR